MRVRVLLPVLAAALAAAAVQTGTAGAVVGNCTPDPGWPASRGDLSSRVVQLVNDYRAQRGLSTLRISSTLAASAVWKARHMARYQYMQHDDPAPPVSRTVQQRLDACGYPVYSSYTGENIAYGNGNYSTPEGVFQAWLNSPPHKADIENPRWVVTGAGAAYNSADGRTYWVQEFGSTDDGSSPPPPPGPPPPPPPPGPPPPPPPSGAPTVRITSAPLSSTTSTDATFAWATSGTVASTACTLDSATVTCSSPKAYARLTPGTHVFRVLVRNSAGSGAATYMWSIAAAITTPPPPPPPPAAPPPPPPSGGGTAPTTSSPRASVRLRLRLASMPKRAVAGRRFVVRLRYVIRDSSGAVLVPTVECRATLAGKPLTGRAAGVGSGAASCAWRLPKASSGKRFAGMVVVRAGKTAARRWFGRTVAATAPKTARAR